jgi:putative FmdB family regulatory protein
MPVFEFTCRACKKPSEILVRDRAVAPACPHCGSADLAKRISLIARPARDGDGDFPGMEGMCGEGGCGDGGCGMDMGGGAYGRGAAARSLLGHGA